MNFGCLPIQRLPGFSVQINAPLSALSLSKALRTAGRKESPARKPSPLGRDSDAPGVSTLRSVSSAASGTRGRQFNFYPNTSLEPSHLLAHLYVCGKLRTLILNNKYSNSVTMKILILKSNLFLPFP